MRVLETGARVGVSRHAVRTSLDTVLALAQKRGEPLTVVHGDAVGADRHTHDWCAAHPEVVEERHSVSPLTWQTAGPRAGHLRNAHMVNLGADGVVAHLVPCDKPGPCRGLDGALPIGHATHGTWGCVQLARAAGIPVWERWASLDRWHGPWGFLSNFHASPLAWDGEVWPTAEHAFNGGKTLDATWRERIRTASSPLEAKRLGRAAPLRPGWDEEVRYAVMAVVIAAKFAGPRRAEALLRTGGAALVEGNRHHDNHWGDCRCGRPACAEPGANYLGRILMRLRADLVGAATTSEGT